MGLQSVRILARLADGSLRIATRYRDQPGWAWPVASSSQEQFYGDVVIKVANDTALPQTDAEFLNLVKAQS